MVAFSALRELFMVSDKNFLMTTKAFDTSIASPAAVADMIADNNVITPKNKRYNQTINYIKIDLTGRYLFIE